MLAEQVAGLIGEPVGTAFLDDAALPEGATVLPLFVGEGQHLREDVPALAAGATLLPALGTHAERLVGMAYDLATAKSRRVNALFALYRFGGFEALAAAIHAANKRCSLTAMGSMHSEPSVSAVLDLWHADGVSPIHVQPLLLFGGKSLARLEAMIASSEAEHVHLGPVLSAHPDFAALVADCFRGEA